MKTPLGDMGAYVITVLAMVIFGLLATYYEMKYVQLHRSTSEYRVCVANWQNLPEVKGRCSWLKDQVLRSLT